MKTVQTTAVVWPASLLPKDWDAGTNVLLVNFAAAYSSVAGDNLSNFSHWHDSQEELRLALKARLDRLGVHASPWALARLWSRLVLPGPSSDALLHLQLWRAMFTDATATFWAQFPYRHTHGGNTHLDITGGTGLGKSSQGATIMIETQRGLTGHALEPGELLRHIGIHASDKPAKLPGLKAGQTYQDDDETEAAGEGSATAAKAGRNTTAMLRFSQINYIRISPELEADKTTQGCLEAIMVHDAMWTLNVFWVGGHPIGLVGVRWMPAAHYGVYAPWKHENTQRVLRQQFGDRSLNAKQALKLLTDSGVVRYLKTFDSEKPRIGDFEDCVLDRAEGMLTSDQSRRIAQLMMRMCLKFSKLAPMFEELYGVPPPPQLKELAALWEGGEL